MQKLNAMDIIPLDTVLRLHAFPTTEFHLKKFTLRDQIWGSQRWKEKELEQAMESQNIAILAEVAWHQLLEKEAFGNQLDNFLDAISTTGDRFEIITQTLTCLGLSQPILEHLQRMEEEVKAGKSVSPAVQTGQSGTI
jgi:hypothetical protein